jgi:hypothetical protein
MDGRKEKRFVWYRRRLKEQKYWKRCIVDQENGCGGKVSCVVAES